MAWSLVACSASISGSVASGAIAASSRGPNVAIRPPTRTTAGTAAALSSHPRLERGSGRALSSLRGGVRVDMGRSLGATSRSGPRCGAPGRYWWSDTWSSTARSAGSVGQSGAPRVTNRSGSGTGLSSRNRRNSSSFIVVPSGHSEGTFRPLQLLGEPCPCPVQSLACGAGVTSQRDTHLLVRQLFPRGEPEYFLIIWRQSPVGAPQHLLLLGLQRLRLGSREGLRPALGQAAVQPSPAMVAAVLVAEYPTRHAVQPRSLLTCWDLIETPSGDE